MKRPLLLLFTIALAGVASGSRPAPNAAAAKDSTGTVVYDVAFDNRTFVTGNNDATSDFRGETFILSGKIYPANTIPAGNGTFDPDATPAIGLFVCRGTQMFAFSDPAATPPIVATTQLLKFDTDDALVTEGLEAGVSPVRRAVVGGWGKYAGANGEVTLELIGFNTTQAEDYRFTFTLPKKFTK